MLDQQILRNNLEALKSNLEVFSLLDQAIPSGLRTIVTVCPA